MIAFIDDHRAAHGVEPICKVLPIAPSTYYDHMAKRANPEQQSERAKRDTALQADIQRVFAENFAVYGACKVWRQLRREGREVARCTVERLMRSMGGWSENSNGWSRSGARRGHGGQAVVILGRTMTS